MRISLLLLLGGGGKDSRADLEDRTHPRPARADKGKDVFLFDGIKKDSNDKEFYYEEFCYKQFSYKEHNANGASSLALSRSLSLSPL